MPDLNVQIALGAEDAASGVIGAVAENLQRVKAEAAGGEAGGNLMQLRAAAEEANAALTGLNVTVNNYGKSAAAASAESTHLSEAVGEGGIAGSLEKVGETFADVAKEAAGFALGMIGISVGMSVFENLRNVVVEYQDKLDVARIGLEAFLGTADAANSVIGSTQGLGLVAPFSNDALLQTTQHLAALGVSAEAIPGQLQDIATAAALAGQGDAGLSGIANVLARIQEVGVLGTRDIRAFASQGVDVYRILEESTGHSMETIKADLTKGKISADEFLAAFHSFELAHGADAFAAMADTIQGAERIIGNASTQIEAGAFKPLNDEITRLVVNTKNFVLSDDFAAWGSGVNSALTSVLGVLDSVDPKLVGIGLTFAAGAAAALLFGPPILAAAAAIDVAAASFSAASISFEALSGVVLGTLGPIGLIAIAAGTAAVVYETNFLGMRDVTNTAVSDGVRGIESWITVIHDFETAVASMKFPSVPGVTLPSVSLPNVTQNDPWSQAIGTLPLVGPAIAAINRETQLATQYTDAQTAATEKLAKARAEANAPFAQASAQADQASAMAVNENFANSITRTIDPLRAEKDAAAQASGVLLSEADVVRLVADSQMELATHTEYAKRGLDAWTPTLRLSRDELNQQHLAAADAALGLIQYSDAVNTAALAADQLAASVHAAAGLESALGGSSALAADFTAADPAAAAYDSQIQGVQDHITQLRDAASQTGTVLKASMEDAIPGLRAFDEATFGLSQHLAGVQLGIERQKLARMEAGGATTPQREAAILQEQIKVAGLERQTEFGPAIQTFQQQSQAAPAGRATNTAEINALQAQQKALEAARAEEAKVAAAETKFWIDQKPAIDKGGPVEQAAAQPLTDLWTAFEARKDQIAAEPAAQAAADYRAFLTQVTTANKELILGAMATQGQEIPPIFHRIGQDTATSLSAGVTSKIAEVARTGGDLGKALRDGVFAGLKDLTAPTGGGATAIRTAAAAGASSAKLGFASGGSFMVGGSGGVDSQLVSFYASPNERVSVGTPSQQGGAAQAVGSLIGQVVINSMADVDAITAVVRDQLTNLYQSGGRSTGRASSRLAGAWGF